MQPLLTSIKDKMNSSNTENNVLYNNIEQAKVKKDLGNEAVRSGNFSLASFYYKQVGLFLSQYASKDPGKDINEENSIVGFISQGKNKNVISSEDQKEIDMILASGKSNLALAQLKLGRFVKAKESATDAIFLARIYEGVGTSVSANSLLGRAHFRRGQAYANIGDLSEARADFEKIVSDPCVVEQINWVRAKEKEADAKERAMFSRMLS